MQVHIISTDMKEDGERGYKYPKDRTLRRDWFCLGATKKYILYIKWHLHTSKLFGRDKDSPY